MNNDVFTFLVGGKAGEGVKKADVLMIQWQLRLEPKLVKKEYNPNLRKLRKELM